jgi:hypothetical protein
LKEELTDQAVVAKFATTTLHGAIEGKTQTHMTEYYNLDVIISVGYRVKSQRGVEFRKWVNTVLKQYIMQGYTLNQKRLFDLGQVLRLMKRTEESLDAKQVLTVVEKYSEAMQLLDSYDHQNMTRSSAMIGRIASTAIIKKGRRSDLRYDQLLHLWFPLVH